MNILVTGAKGFVGRNLCHALMNIRDRKDRTHPEIQIDEIYQYDIDSTEEELIEYCAKADFVFNLAGVNRPKDPSEFMQGNRSFIEKLCNALKEKGNKCPVMISSSVQATLEGRYDTEYGRSKLAGEEYVFSYGEDEGVRVLVYRFPNLFGKWCRPNYNSAVATFCNNIANDLAITVNDPTAELELLYIDDLCDEMIAALEGNEHRGERFCFVPTTHRDTQGLLCKEALFYISFLSAKGKDFFSLKDEPGRPRQLYRASAYGLGRTGKRKYLKAGSDQGSALA